MKILLMLIISLTLSISIFGQPTKNPKTTKTTAAKKIETVKTTESIRIEKPETETKTEIQQPKVQEPVKKTNPETKIPEPEYIGVFWAFDPETGKMTSLERQKLKLYQGVKGGFFSAKAVAIAGVDGAKSPTRFMQNRKFIFVVRAESNLVDPVNLLEVRKFNVANNMRIYEMSTSKFGVYTGGKTTSQASAKSEMNISRHGTASFTISFELEPGEYVLVSKQNENVFCFGVDPDPSQMPDLSAVVGRYERKGSKKDYLELKADGSFFLSEKGKNAEGRYSVSGSTIRLEIAGTTVATELNGDTIVDNEKQKWVRIKP